MNKPVEIYRVQEERNQTLVLNTDLSAVSSPSGSDMEIEKEKRKEEESDRRENSTESQISQSYEEEVENDENSHLDPKITYDRENRKSRIKFSWPSRVINNESRDAEKDIPVSVVTPGKRTKKPV